MRDEVQKRLWRNVSERNKERGCEREASILEGVDLSVLKWIEYMKRMTGKGLIKNGVYGGRGGSR